MKIVKMLYILKKILKYEKKSVKKIFKEFNITEKLFEIMLALYKCYPKSLKVLEITNLTGQEGYDLTVKMNRLSKNEYINLQYIGKNNNTFVSLTKKGVIAVNELFEKYRDHLQQLFKSYNLEISDLSLINNFSRVLIQGINDRKEDYINELERKEIVHYEDYASPLLRRKNINIDDINKKRVNIMENPKLVYWNCSKSRKDSIHIIEYEDDENLYSLCGKYLYEKESFDNVEHTDKFEIDKFVEENKEVLCKRCLRKWRDWFIQFT